jgi:hypothetical protein
MRDDGKKRPYDERRSSYATYDRLVLYLSTFTVNHQRQKEGRMVSDIRTLALRPYGFATFKGEITP